MAMCVSRLMRGTVLVAAFMLDIAWAQTATVQGIVTDARNGERLPYATVMIKGNTSGTKTNVEGIFVLPNLPAAVCTLEVRYLGYASQEVRVDARKPVDIILIKLNETIIAGEEVTIVAEPEPRTLKAEKDPSLIVLSPRELSALPNVGEVDLFRALQMLPGVTGTNDASSGLYVRGGAPDQNLVLFDGMAVHHVDHFFGFFSAFNVDAVKDVQFYKGGFPAKYGGALSSVVDMTGRTGDQNKWRGGIGANLLSFHGDLEVPLWNQGSLFLAGRSTYGDSKIAKAIYEYLTGEQSNTPGVGRGPGGGGPPGFANANVDAVIPLPSFYDVNAKATYYLTPTDALAASLYHSNDGLDKSQTSAVGNTTDKTTQGNLGFSGRWFHQWTGNLFSNIVVANSQYTSNYDFGVQVSDTSAQRARGGGMGMNENNSTNEFSLRIDNDWHPHQDHSVGFGLQLSQTTTSYSLDLTDPFRDSSSNLLSISQRGLQAALYAQDEWSLTPLLSVTLGARATYYQPTRQTFFDPRLSARCALTENISVKGAVGTYRQFLNRIVNESITQGSRDFWVLTGDQFSPGRSDHLILGATWENADFLFDVEAYRKTMSGLVEFSQRFRMTATDLYAFATGTGVSRGVEFLLQKKHGMFTGWISYTLSNTEYTFPSINRGVAFPAAQDQRHELKIMNTMAVGQWKFAASWLYGSGKPYTAPISQYFIELLDGSELSYVHVGEKNSFRLPPYHRLDVSVSRTFPSETGGMDFVLGLSVFNLYNRRNISYYKYDLSTQPVEVTEISSLGITPTAFVQLNF